MNYSDEAILLRAIAARARNQQAVAEEKLAALETTQVGRLSKHMERYKAIVDSLAGIADYVTRAADFCDWLESEGE